MSEVCSLIIGLHSIYLVCLLSLSFVFDRWRELE